MAMSELPSADLDVLTAAVVAALTGVALGASTNAHYVRLHRARARLRRMVG